MISNRRRDTKPELAIRKLIHAAEFRYRTDFAPLGDRRRADIVFTRIKLAVFVDGCFWHRCPLHATFPKRHGWYWEAKLRRNEESDRETDDTLRNVSWTVLRY